MFSRFNHVRHGAGRFGAAEFAALAAPDIPCGYFTLLLTDGGVRRFRIRAERRGPLAGRRTLARDAKLEVAGAEVTSWERIGVLTAAGFVLDHKWKAAWESKWAAALWDLLRGADGGGYTLLARDVRCTRCMRQLPADEAAQRTRLGPECRKLVAQK